MGSQLYFPADVDPFMLLFVDTDVIVKYSGQGGLAGNGTE